MSTRKSSIAVRAVTLFAATLVLFASCATVGTAPASTPTITPAAQSAAPSSSPAPEAPKAIKVACVGDSITWGYGLERAESYPTQLASLLGSGWNVRNFGVNSTTLLRRGDQPYINTTSYKASLEFEPDMVLIMLGTNDSKYTNFQYSDDFEADYQALIAAYRALPSHPLVITALPAWVVGEGQWGITNEVLVEEEIPLIRNVVAATGVQLVDIHAATDQKPELFLEDNVHPNAAGAKVIAQSFADALKALEPAQNQHL